MMTREEFLKRIKQPDWPVEKQEERRIFEEKLKRFGGLTRPNLDRLAEELTIRMQMAVEIVRYLSYLERENERAVMKDFLEFYLDSLKKRVSAFAKEATNEKAD